MGVVAKDIGDHSSKALLLHEWWGMKCVLFFHLSCMVHKVSISLLTIDHFHKWCSLLAMKVSPEFKKFAPDLSHLWQV